MNSPLWPNHRYLSSGWRWGLAIVAGVVFGLLASFAGEQYFMADGEQSPIASQLDTTQTQVSSVETALANKQSELETLEQERSSLTEKTAELQAQIGPAEKDLEKLTHLQTEERTKLESLTAERRQAEQKLPGH